MSRLVDADALIEIIKESKPLNWTDSESELQEDADYNHFIEMVNSQPTAYDIEKVVWELECEKTIWCGLKITTTDTMSIDDAIEIVKRGGAT